MIRVNSQSFSLTSTLRKKNNNDHNANNHEQHIIKSQSFPIQIKPNNRQSSDSLRLHYVTQRILASILPKRDPENQIRINGKLEDRHEIEILSMLEQKHGKNYRVFDLESCISIITLERICELCKHIDSWLGTGQEKVVVLQDREDRQRLGTAISAYLEYLDICSTNYTGRNASLNEDIRIQNTIARNWLDLDIFSMRKFLEDFIGSQTIPSHRRYLEYFAGLLAGKIRMNSAPLYLNRISIESPPAWLRYDNRLATQSSEWITFIKIYEGLKCVHISDIHIIPITTRQFLFEIGSLRLRGDILIRCYHIISSGLQPSGYNQETRELLFSIQFHTCAIGSRDVVFYRKDMDLACDDSRFPSDHKAVFYFTNSTSKENCLAFQSPLIRTLAPNEIAKFDSIENIDIASSCHTHGPIDGSLYATILKSPKSPQFPFPFPTNNSSPSIQQQQQPHKHQAYNSQNLISPPPQFSNQNQQQQQQQKKDYEFVENSQAVVALRNDTIDRGTINAVPKIAGNNLTKIEKNNNQQIVSRPGGRNSIEIQHQLPASTSQSNFRETHKYTVPVNLNPLETRNIIIVETYNSAIDKRYGPNYHQQQHGGGQQECVRSPLTLSMDSGISSNGILNRPQPGSSVSPSSFPSQASPQEDRDRELDDILSDMLMTVQDIPDFSKSTKQQNQQHSHNTIIRSQSVIPTSGNYVVPVQYNSNQQLSSHYNNTIKRSQSYNIEQPSPFGQNSYIPKDRQQDIYDTASTTTTLTPPPSESGRDTPIGGIYSNSGSVTNISASSEHQYRQTIPREKREISYSAAAIPVGSNQQQQQQQRQQMIMSLHQQSTIYPQTVRTDSVTVSASEDEDIPYHAREYSQPFSYGSVPPNNTFRTVSPSGDDDPAMIKTQSGLSSPSLVRKTLRAPSPSMSSGSLRKTPQRVDFEEMLRGRREKVMSEKYSKSDRPSNFSDFGSRSFDGENQWSYNNSSSYRANHQDSYDQSGRHRLYEPLRRSNTMDGPFLRSNSTDGISGQTWLQLQQQKLRAKKDQEYNDNRRYFEEVVHNEIRGRPFRSRANYSRNDGYASDTAAFMDEVDYRRPLQIETPYYQKLPNEAFNTKITTTTTVTRERPFVAVKRAHDQAKQSAINVREESFSSYRSETDPELSITSSPRPETPAFPVTPRTPYGLSINGSVSPALPPKSPTSLRKDLYSGNQKGHVHEVVNQNDTISCYASRRNSNASNANSELQDVAPHLVKFVRDSSKYWYKPNISREEAVVLLRNAEPGTFLVRDSTTYKNAFGLVVRVAQPPPGVELKTSTGDELVRHFLVEPTLRGVRLKGCNNEPVFSSLSALVYQHSITPLALPCRLIIPDQDIQSTEIHSPAQRQLLSQGAACNVVYLFTCETESLTGEEAIRKAVSQLFIRKPLPPPTEVHFKAAHQGITLTDNTRRNFFRKHYPANSVSFCGLDPERRTWSIPTHVADIPVSNKTIFAFVARRSASSKDNQCHVFCDLQTNQPALAIVSFVNKVLPTEMLINSSI